MFNKQKFFKTDKTNYLYNSLDVADPELNSLIEKEKFQNKKTLNMVYCENYPSRAVLEALGSVFNTKYSEGYPGKRYYA